MEPREQRPEDRELGAQNAARAEDMTPSAPTPNDPGARPWPPLPPDLDWTSPVRAETPSYRPLPPDLAGTPGQVAGSGDAATGSGASIPPAGAGMPPGGQPPYSPPYGWAWPPGGPSPEPAPPRRRGRRAVLAAGAAVALVAGGLGAGLGVALSGNSSSGNNSSSSGGIAKLPRSQVASSSSKHSVGAIAAAVEPSVVDINVSVASAAGSAQAQAAGTGMIVTSSGQVLTNNHVVENAMSIQVVVPHHGRYTARVIGVDPTKDVALLQIVNAPQNLPYVALGDSSKVALGNSVIAIGNAYGLGGSPSIATGVISALNRTITASDASATTSTETLHGMLQTDAPIAAGDSGGPLVNSSGQVIGMDTAAASGDGGTLGFAIPINTARTIVEQIEAHKASGTVIMGASPFLGIYEVPSASQPSALGGSFSGLPGYGTSGTSGTSVSGVVIYDVVTNSPAQKAGLTAGDTITAVNGKRTPTWSSLTKIIGADKPGQRITVTYVETSGASRTVGITLTGLPK